MRSAWATARWSIHTMTFQRSSSLGETVTGRSAASRRTSEQVASKPTPATLSAVAPAAARAARAAAQHAAQMSSEDCSTKSSSGRWRAMG